MIEPYYSEGGITIYKGDCREVLPQLSDVGMLFADPPFNVGKKYSGSAKKDARDDYYEWCESWIEGGFSCLSDSGSFYLMTITRHLAHVWPMMEKRGEFISQVVWRNHSGAVHTREFWPSYQPVLLYGKTESYFFNVEAESRETGQRRWGGYSKGSGYKGRITDTWDDIPMIYSGSISHPEAILKRGTKQKAHPCQMPLSLVGRAMAFSLPPGATIVDCFSGSGTTLRAAKNAGVKAIGIEIEEEYCEMAAKRMAQSAFNFEEVA